MRVLGIETSCDETAVAIVDDHRTVLSHALATQVEDHKPYGGVVPEIAARSHLDHLDVLVTQALDEAELTLSDLDGIAATAGPGLIGGVIVGVMTAKAIAAAQSIPFIAVNHLEGHALTVRLTDDVAFPYVLLLASGGHCQFLLAKGVDQYQLLGTTLDDSAGECFDKVAKMLGLGFPGGPALEAAAREGDASRFDLPRPLAGRPGCDLSFSGLKTAVRQSVEGLPPGPLSDKDTADLAAAVQAAIVESLSSRAVNAVTLAASHAPTAFVAAGGVAANTHLRMALQAVAENHHLPFVVPPSELCTDNGVMIAWAGLERLRLGFSDPLSFKPHPRWPLDQSAA